MLYDNNFKKITIEGRTTGSIESKFRKLSKNCLEQFKVVNEKEMEVESDNNDAGSESDSESSSDSDSTD